MRFAVGIGLFFYTYGGIIYSVPYLSFITQ